VRSRSNLEFAGLALGAAAEGIWSRQSGAALTGRRQPLWPSSLRHRRHRRVSGAASQLGGVGERAARLLAVTLALVAAGVLLAAGTPGPSRSGVAGRT